MSPWPRRSPSWPTSPQPQVRRSTCRASAQGRPVAGGISSRQPSNAPCWRATSRWSCTRCHRGRVRAGRRGRELMELLKVVVISGRVGAGKSTLAHGLADRYGAHLVSTKELLQLVAERNGEELLPERGALQTYGTRLDEETGGAWVAEAVAARMSGAGIAGQEPGDQGPVGEDDEPTGLWVVDAVRIQEQIDQLR